MLLAIDAGNSNVKLGYHDGNDWRERYCVALNDFCVAPLQYLREIPQQIVIANVAGEKFYTAFTTALPNVKPHWVKATRQACGVTSHYELPEQLGADRWAILVAARSVCLRACVVASIGTAVTADMLTQEGSFLGGVILPGLHLMRNSLAIGTDAVKAPLGHVTCFPCNTADAVETGLYYAVAGAIEKNVMELEKNTRQPVQCLLTGGDAHLIAPYFNKPVQVMENLVLEGLLRLSQKENAL